MNGDLCVSGHLIPVMTSYLTQQSWKCLQIVNGNMQSFTSQICVVVGSLREKLNFLDPWDLKFKDMLITKSPKSSSTQ